MFNENFISKTVFILRGNHEFGEMCSKFGFMKEIEKVYGMTSVLDQTYSAFSYMSLVAIINNTVFCAHGGLGPTIKSIADLSHVRKPILNYIDPICESLVWSDPDSEIQQYESNSRGYGYLFGKEAFDDFMSFSNLSLFVRGHECVQNGIKKQFDKKLLTIFSASNYTGHSNSSSIVLFDKDDIYQPYIFSPLKSLNHFSNFLKLSSNRLVIPAYTRKKKAMYTPSKIPVITPMFKSTHFSFKN